MNDMNLRMSGSPSAAFTALREHRIGTFLKVATKFGNMFRGILQIGVDHHTSLADAIMQAAITALGCPKRRLSASIRMWGFRIISAGRVQRYATASRPDSHSVTAEGGGEQVRKQARAIHQPPEQQRARSAEPARTKSSSAVAEPTWPEPAGQS
jgi:hypothetical protein